MTAIEIATGIIDKLQEENRVCLETLHKAQDTIKYSERQLAEKDRLIKVLEERLRTGTDGILEMTNRQKELTIKHLELQIQKLLKENEDFEVSLEAIKAEICPKCETKLLLRENSENRGISKSYKPPGKSSSSLFEKKSSQTLCPNRVKALERIIEHKDKRIMHLSKEVQRLTKVEKELTQKVYRLTKLLPMSRLPPETLTDCLLKEIQLLESQKQDCNSSHQKLLMVDVLNKIKKDNPSTFRTSVSSKVSFSKPSDKFKKSGVPSIKRSAENLPDSEQMDASDVNKIENEVLFKKLQKLCNDVNELKRLFAFESEKLSYGLSSTASEYNTFKTHLEEIIDNLNDVVQNILGNDLNVCQQDVSGDLSVNSDDKYVISCLQDRLKETLGMLTDYENENKALKGSLDKLKARLALQCSCSDDHRKSEEKSNLKHMQNDDLKKSHEFTRIKEAAESTCQKFIDELHKTLKCSSCDNSKKQCSTSTAHEVVRSNSCEQQNKDLRTKLDVAEKNINICESVIEQLQNKVRHLEEENVRIESELHEMKSKAVTEASIHQTGVMHSRLSDSHINSLKKYNQGLQTKVSTLEETTAKLEDSKKSNECKMILIEAFEQERISLKSKLDASEKQICTLEKSIEVLQEKLKTVEEEKNKLESELKNITVKNNLAETYEHDVMSLKNELILKGNEIRELKESLRTLENKTSEMNYYRKSLHLEIENLCNALMESEDSEDSTRRKTIYKAAVLRSAQALLQLDDDYNLKPEDSNNSSALDELTRQIQIYLNEVSRIHELVTIKEKERDELLREYLDLPDDAILRPSPSRQFESHIQGQPSMDGNLQSSPNLISLGLPAAEKIKPEAPRDENAILDPSVAVAELKVLQEELNATKSVTTYLLSSCTRLEELLTKERTERAKCEMELEVCKETVKDLKAQLNMKNSMTKRLNNLIETMRSKECNDEITLQQLKSEIKWLSDENQKIFEKVTATQSELGRCKEENSRIQNDLESLKRQLLNEKYENAKVNNELRHLRSQISNSQSMLQET